MAANSECDNSGRPQCQDAGTGIIGGQPDSLEPSGTQLERFRLRHATPGGAYWYASRVQKTIPAYASWLGKLSGDGLVREVALWTSGLLQRLPAGISTGVLCAKAPPDPTGEQGAGRLIMKDLAGRQLRDRHGRPWPPPPLTPPGSPPPIVLRILHQLARLHAAYWEDPQLDDAATGLMNAQDALLLLAPERLSTLVAEGDASAYLPLALASWKAFFQIAAPEDAATLLRVFQFPESVLPSMAAAPRTLVHGDVWGPNLGTLPASRHAPRRGRSLLLLDWGLATAGPSTYDVLWLSGTWHALYPPGLLAAYRARLESQLAAHGKRISAATWRAMADAGYLRTALTCGEALARSATQTLPGAGRYRMEARVRWWAARAAQAARRLGAETRSLQSEELVDAS
ncbi:MAG: phosphotransferase family protein [Ktedonobacterales bacterium]